MYKKPSIKKNYLYNLSYQILQLITPFITVPYVSRVLTVEGVGIQSFTASIVSYFVLFGALSIGLYGQREIAYNQNDPNERTRIVLELSIIKGITVCISLLVYFAVIRNFHNYYYYFLIYSIEIISSLFDITWYYQGLENFKIIIIRNIIIRIVSITLIVCIIKEKSDLYKYILLLSGSNFIANVGLIPLLVKQLVRIKIKSINVIRHIKPVFLLFIPVIAAQVYTVLDKSMIGIITQSAYENGCYEQSTKTIRMLLVIITSLGIVIVPRMASLNADKKYDEIEECLVLSFRFSCFLGAPMFLGLLGIADIFVPLFFGPGYDKSITLIKILSGLFIAIGFNNIIGVQYLLPVKKENVFTITIIIGAIVSFTLNLVLIPCYQSVGAAISSVAAESAIAIIQFIYIRKLVSLRKIFLQSWHYMAFAAIMFLLLSFLRSFMTITIFCLFLMILTGITAYIIPLLIIRDKFLLGVIHKLFGSVIKCRILYKEP